MSRSFPQHPNLDSDRKRAKALKRDFVARDADAVARVREHHPRYRLRASDPARFRLADAQLVVAREYGLESWPRLVAVVAFLRSDFEQRTRMLLDAALGEHPPRAHDLLAAAPEFAAASLALACAVGDAKAARNWLDREPAAAERRGGVPDASPLWILCWSNLHLGIAGVDAARIQIAKWLLAAGADANVCCERESSWGRHTFSAVYGATQYDRPGLVEALLEAGADPNDGESLYHATENPDSRCLKLLLRHGATIAGTNALLRALDRPNLRAVRALLAAGADPAEIGPGGRNALHHAVLRGCEPGVLELLVERGVPIERTDASGRTAYQIARRHGFHDAADYLRSRGADGSVQPIDRFIGACEGGDGELARAMIDRGEIVLDDLEADDLGALPRSAAWGRVAAVSTMLELGFPLETDSGAGWTGTALNHAAFNGQSDVVALLLERGADPELENEFGGTALGAVAWSSLHGDATFCPEIPESERQRRLARCAELLCAAGAGIRPNHLVNARPLVAEALRSHGGAH